MAVVLDAFASYLQNMLTEMAREEVAMLLGVSGEINRMGVKLEDLKNFLADADRRNITDQSVQGWVRELKGAMYDATDILDLCKLRAMDQPGASIDLGCCNPLLFCLRNPLFAHDIGSRIKALNQRLGDIKERSAAFSFISNLDSYEDRSSKARASRPASRETSGELDRLGIVGEKIEEDTRKLVEMLTRIEGGTSREDNKMMVLAIVGVGGIGKTTLAQNIFNDETIQPEFHKKIWLSVNQDYNEAELLRRTIIEAGGDHRRSGDAKTMLQRTLKDALNGQKTLLVMDDVWSEQAWEVVLKTPLINAVAEGSRVLVTTRNDMVARGMKARKPYHRVDTLGLDDAWLLLKKQVVSSELDEPDVDMLKDIGLEIIARCGGLPLAIKVMGGLLCKREKKRPDWEKVLNDSIWSVSGMPQELNCAIYLSYEDLPPYMKQCFLHYSLLPKNTKNKRFFNNTVVSMWISEGFLHGNLDESEELGSECYKELILRNLIEPDTNWPDHWVCNMHDVVRSFAQYVARDEALVTYNRETLNIIRQRNSHKFHRLSIETKASESDEFKWSFLHAQESLRTLISIGQLKIKPGDSLITFSKLRTLHIESANVAALVESVYLLKHLRYMSLRYTDISRLPENINKMEFLQYISLRGCESFMKLPDGIVKLEQLSYLDLSYTCINSIPRGFRGLTNLRKLRGFQAHVDGDWCSLEELGPLSKLKILGLQSLENVSTALSAAKARLGEKAHLTDLFLQCGNRLGDDGLVKEGGVSDEEQRQIEEVFHVFCPPPCLDLLCIWGYFGRRLPMWMMSTVATPLKNLRILGMHDLACCSQLPDGLCQLPCLQFLQILRAPAIERVGSEFLQPIHHHNHHLVVAFPRLHKMRLIGMVEWKEWEWEEQVQAMPVLEELWLNGCKLMHVPPGLASHARALKRLYVLNVQHLNSLENFASLIELELYKNLDLERITNLPKLQKLDIICCPKLKVLEGMLALQRLQLWDCDMETLPTYLKDVNPRHLQLECSLALLVSMAAGPCGLEWDKFSHVEHVKAYAGDRDNSRKWYVLYTKGDPSYNLETNIVVSSFGSVGISPMNDAPRLATGKKLLLVMDDVWSHGAWEGVLKTPLVNAAARGSRVLITTRDERVARAMQAVQPYHHVNKLGPEDAWLLLKKQVVSGEIDEAQIVEALKDIGMEIIARCGGLLLAVKVMGGLLCQREKQRCDWEKVLNDSMWSEFEMPEELNYAVYLSYEDLPPYMKQCFLHYSLLPKNIVLFRDAVVAMWISEGFLHGNSVELEALGGEYYKQLILRNLIVPDRKYVDQRVCNMHDIVRSFAQYVARDEALVAHNRETLDIIIKRNSHKFYRLSIETKGSESDEFEWSFLHAQKSLRTLISIGQLKIKPGDSLITFSRLQTVHIESANVATLVESLYQLKHLRYMSLRYTDTRLPENLSKMKFLQYISLRGCKSLAKLPDGIVKLGQLRHLSLTDTSTNSILRGFRGLTDLRKLHGFQAHVDGDWCSLEELGPLSKLRRLGLVGIENVSATSSAAKARLGEKTYLTDLSLQCARTLGDDGLVREGEGASEEEQRLIEEVFDELCPPPCLNHLVIKGYFGRRPPMWMMSTAAEVTLLKSLRILFMENLTYCTQLPDGLCQLPCLQFLQIDCAPAIERVGSEFLQQLYHHHPSSQAVAAFPRLRKMNLIGMAEWEEWEWEEQVQAMLVLEELHIVGCKLKRVPPGLASHARALKRLRVSNVQHLNSLENFASLVELYLYQNPDLERITNLPKLQKVVTIVCPNMKVLQGAPALHRLVLKDCDMKTHPEYMPNVNPKHLQLDCNLELLTSIAEGQSRPEWDKFRHIQQMKAYADDGDNKRKWYVLYTRDPPYKLETNIDVNSSQSAGTKRNMALVEEHEKKREDIN